jgi:hypothetical protein
VTVGRRSKDPPARSLYAPPRRVAIGPCSVCHEILYDGDQASVGQLRFATHRWCFTPIRRKNADGVVTYSMPGGGKIQMGGPQPKKAIERRRETFFDPQQLVYLGLTERQARVLTMELRGRAATPSAMASLPA